MHASVFITLIAFHFTHAASCVTNICFIAVLSQQIITVPMTSHCIHKLTLTNPTMIGRIASHFQLL